MDDQGVHDNNIRHEESLKVVSDAVKAGIKIKQGPVLIRKIEKSSINRKQHAKDNSSLVLAGLSTIEKFKAVLTKHKELTRRKVMDLAGLGNSTVSACAKKLLEEGFLTKELSGNSDGKEILFKLAEK